MAGQAGRPGAAARWANIRRVDALLGTCALPQLRERTSAKWRTHPADVLPAFVAEMDFDLAPPITRAVTAALASGDCGYAHKGALGEAYAAFAADRLGWDVDPGRVYPIPDVMTGLAEVIEAITPPGSGIVVNPPVYPPFRFRFGFYGRRIIDAPLTRDETGRYDLDPAAIEAALSQPGAAAYVLCSPHNPTGNVWSARQLEMVADLCHRHGATLLVDEIHAPLVLPGVAGLPGARPGRRPGHGVPGQGADRGQPRPRLRQPGQRFRAAEHRHLARADRRGGPPDGPGLPGRGSARGALALAQQVAGDLHLSQVLADLLHNVKERVTLADELELIGPGGRAAPWPRLRVGGHDVSA